MMPVTPAFLYIRSPKEGITLYEAA